MVKKLQKTGVPVIYFGTDSATLLPVNERNGRRRDRSRLADPAR